MFKRLVEKSWYYTMECYYAIIQKNDELYTMTFSDFQETLLSDKSTMQKNIYGMLALCKIIMKIRKDTNLIISTNKIG